MMAHLRNNTSTGRVSITIDVNDVLPLSQEERIVAALASRPKSMLELSDELRMLRSSVCRAITRLRRCGRISCVGHGVCRLSRRWVKFFSSDSIFKGVHPMSEISEMLQADRAEGMAALELLDAFLQSHIGCDVSFLLDYKIRLSHGES